jgi:hypothetical protein
MSPTLAPTSSKLIRPPSASCDLRHAAEESFRARGCTTATRRQPGHATRSPNSKEEGYKSNPQEEELDQEIRNLKAIHQQVERKREKMLRLSDLQKKIDEAAEEICHLTQDD